MRDEKDSALEIFLSAIASGAQPPSTLAEYYDKYYHGYGREKATEPFGKPEKFHAPRNRAILATAGVKPEHRILETGCGGGQVVYMLAREFGCRNIVACDFSRVAVEFVQRAYPFVLGVVCSVDAMPFAPAAFDVVLSLDVTEHLFPATYQAALKEYWRVLRPGGTLALLHGATGPDTFKEHVNILPNVKVLHDLQLLGFWCEAKAFELNGRTDEWILARRPG